MKIETVNYKHSKTGLQKNMSDVQFALLPRGEQELWEVADPDEAGEEEDDQEGAQKGDSSPELAALRAEYTAATGKPSGRKSAEVMKAEIARANDKKLTSGESVKLNSANPSPEDEGA